MYKKKATPLILAAFLTCLGLGAQNAGPGKASGTVVDASGAPVIGAGVLIKGTTTGSISDTEGNFSLEGVPAGSVLEVSCIGFETKEIVWNGKTLSVVLSENSLELDQVVVVGYGTMKKSDLTGSIAKADLSSVKTAPNHSILQSLQGSVPGLNIGQTNTAGADPSVEIRGQITISGNTSPLVVLDGIIYNGSISDLNPNDIKSIDILKDASSKAVYGAKAANGVVIITTKGGKNEFEPKITYSSNWSWSNPTKNFRPLNREEWIKMARDVDYKNAYTAESGYLEENPEWSFTSTGMNSTVYGGIESGASYDWWGNSTRTGHLHTNSVSVSGGSKSVSYFVSGGWTDQAGIIKNDDYTRATMRANVDIRIRPWLKVGTNTFLSFSNYSGDSPNVGSVSRMPSVIVPKDEDGDWIVNPSGNNLVNPFLAAQTEDSDKRSQVNTTVYAQVDMPWVKGLSYKINYNYTQNSALHSNFDPWDAGQQGVAYKQSSGNNYWLLDNIINYSGDFGRHSVNATLVYGANRTVGDTFKAEGTNYQNGTLGFNDLSQAAIPEISSSAWSESNLYQMARLAYNYDGRYFATATLRRDGFSAFAENCKFGLFPSAGLGWTISNESWMEGAHQVDNLKLRASYGVTGNQTKRYASLAKVGVVDGYVFGDGAGRAPGLYISAMANKDLKWETTAEFNLGLDFAFFANRLSGSVDFFNATTTDLLWAVSIPTMTGFESVNSNLGELNLKGMELSLDAVPVKTKDFTWTVKGTFSATKNKVVSLLGEDNDGDGEEDDLIASGLFMDKPLSTIYGYEVEGIWQLEDEAAGIIPQGFYPGNYKIKDQNGDGQISAAEDRVILGRRDPAFRMGIRNTFDWKGFNLSFFINIINGGKDGYLDYNEKANYLGNSQGNAVAQNLMSCYDYWSPSNPDAKFATAWQAPAVDADILQSRSFARLQDITFGYTFGKAALRKSKIDNLRVFASGKNILTLTKWDGWDPEMSLGVGTTTYPVMRTLAVGAEITF